MASQCVPRSVVKITPTQVIEAEEFGALYFSVVDGTVRTILRSGMMICHQSPRDGYITQSMIVKITEFPDGIAINSYTEINGAPKFCYVEINSRMYIRTDCTYVPQLKRQNVVYKIGMRVYLAAQHAVGTLSLEESVGVIEKIFQYVDMGRTVFFKLRTSQGYRIAVHSEFYCAIHLQEDENVSILAAQINTVGVGARVRLSKHDKNAVVLAVLYFKVTSSTPAGYIVRTDDGSILTVDYRDRILPVEPAVENVNVLRSYHALAAEKTDIFLHHGVELKHVNDDLVSVVHAVRHEFTDHNYGLTPVNAYLRLDESIPWKDYGFICPE